VDMGIEVQVIGLVEGGFKLFFLAVMVVLTHCSVSITGGAGEVDFIFVLFLFLEIYWLILGLLVRAHPYRVSGVAGKATYHTGLGLMLEWFYRWRILSRKTRSKV